MKKSKTLAGKAKRLQQMTKEEIIATLLKKKQCNAKALSIVEGMLEVEVNPQWLCDSLQFITQSHYQDAVEERSIMKICGYPLCRNPLLNVPKQQFRISTQNNKVYDISERKNFCSNACYRSSTFLKDQVMTSPLWLRDIEKVPVFKLLDESSDRGGMGDEIDVGPTKVTAQEASIGHSTSDESRTRPQKEDDNNGQSCKLEESSQNVSAEKNSSENFAAPAQDEPDIPTMEGNKMATTSGNEQICFPDEIVEKILPTEKELEAMDTRKQRINLEGSSMPVELGISSSDCLETRVKAFSMDNSDERNAGLRKSVLESISSESQELLAGSIEKNSFTRRAENSEEKSNLRSTEDSQKKTAEKNVEDSGDKNANERSTEGSKQKKEIINKKPKRTSKHADRRVLPVATPSVSALVEDRLTEWFTVDSLCFLYGEQKTREMLGLQGGDLEQNFKPLDSATWDPEKYDRFVNICKRLNLLDLEDKRYDEKVINEDKNVVTKPLPDFNKLREEAKKMDLRVQAFYKGQLEVEPKKVTFAEDSKEEAEFSELPVIPLVHQHEQRALRRRLVLDSLNRVLPDLLRTVGVHSSEVNSALRGLVGTFALTATNITFNPRQWTLVAIAIIKLLSVREARLHVALVSEASQKYLTLIQMSYNLDPTFLDLLMDRLVFNAIAPPKPTEMI